MGPATRPSRPWARWGVGLLTIALLIGCGASVTTPPTAATPTASPTLTPTPTGPSLTPHIRRGEYICASTYSRESNPNCRGSQRHTRANVDAYATPDRARAFADSVRDPGFHSRYSKEDGSVRRSDIRRE